MTSSLGQPPILQESAMKKLILIFIVSGLLTGCFVSNPYKNYSLGINPNESECLGAKLLEESEIKYACVFFDAWKDGGLKHYLMLTKVNGTEISNDKVFHNGVQAIALPSEIPLAFTTTKADVRTGFGWDIRQQPPLVLELEPGSNYFFKWNSGIEVINHSTGEIVDYSNAFPESEVLIARKENLLIKWSRQAQELPKKYASLPKDTLDNYKTLGKALAFTYKGAEKHDDSTVSKFYDGLFESFKAD